MKVMDPRSLVLPLDVSLSELYNGTARRVKVSLAQLQRAGHHHAAKACGGGDGALFFEVPVGRGAPDGHWIEFPMEDSSSSSSSPSPSAPSSSSARGGGSVCFVLQERRHTQWRRRGLDLYTERTITLREALLGYCLIIEHLDGRRLPVVSRPGEVVQPRNLLPNAEAEWERFDHTDAFPGQDAGSMRTQDLQACKAVCRQHGYSAFTYWEDTAYFRMQSRTEVLAARAAARGATLFVCPDPSKSACLRAQRALPGEGMPAFRKSGVWGNLFVLLKVEFPQQLDDCALEELLRGGGGGCCGAMHALIMPTAGSQGSGDSSDGDGDEDVELCDLDPIESVRQQHIVTGGASFCTFGNQDADEMPSRGPQLGGSSACRQM
eukprot:NODE_9435_length_1424_cov_8.234387.p1 GENE.NODE_9435_length_1424_cov_8.234387~~NODE_9435_length_1424_cov_8.234387.p1  ORF type:complete len:378 (+),score=100.94 NODE_9435_length_1424_cov_8.234387:101-1234(+)